MDNKFVRYGVIGVLLLIIVCLAFNHRVAGSEVSVSGEQQSLGKSIDEQTLRYDKGAQMVKDGMALVEAGEAQARDAAKIASGYRETLCVKFKARRTEFKFVKIPNEDCSDFMVESLSQVPPMANDAPEEVPLD